MHCFLNKDSVWKQQDMSSVGTGLNMLISADIIPAIVNPVVRSVASTFKTMMTCVKEIEAQNIVEEFRSMGI